MTKPFEVSDLELLQLPADVALYGERAVCEVEYVDRGGDTYCSGLWLFSLRAGTPHPLTRGNALDSRPRWSPDGRWLGFLSDRDGGAPQAFRIDPNGGEARPISSVPNGLVAFEWAAGRHLLATAKCKVARDARWKDAPDSKVPKVVDRLPYKTDGIGFTLDREIHLFRIDVENGKHEQLTHGAFDVRSFGVSRDGKWVAYARTREGRLRHRTEIWLSRSDGDAARQITHDVPSTQYPCFSPDGTRIAFVGSGTEGEARAQLWLLDIEGNKLRRLGDADLEVDPAPLQWIDDQTVAFLRAWRGRQHLATLDVNTCEIRTLIAGDRHVTAFAAGDDAIAFVVADAATAPEIHVTAGDGSGERTVSSFNSWWQERTPLRAQLLSFDVPDGDGGTESIDGWLVCAADTSAATNLLVDAHGGPQSYALFDHAAHVYWPVLASRGWAILALNPVGSSSYGHEFAERLLGNWGRYDLPQYVAAVRALQKEGRANAQVAITGKSYGGYLTAWAIGQTDLFKAAVVSAPVINLESHMGTSDSGYYVSPYALGDSPEEERRRYAKLSPLHHLENARTPTLILQGEKDQRCPIGQSEELFSSLTRLDACEAQMVIYPGASHQLASRGKPSLRRDYHSRLVEWLTRWCEDKKN